MNDIAIAHKDYDVRGGGELLAEQLADAFDCPLYVGNRSDSNEPDEEVDIRQIHESRIGDRLIERGGMLRSLAYMNRWRTQSEDLYDYDTVILSGNEPLWWMPQDDQTVVAYTHTPPRWLYDLFPTAVENTTQWRDIAARWLQEVQRQLYEDQVNRPDLFVANSDLVARRIKRYWNIDEEKIMTVYPPVRTHQYDPKSEPTGDYYCTLSRLTSTKRIAEIVKTFNEREETLLVAGRGPEQEQLEKLAGENVKILGYVSETEKERLLAGAMAFVYNSMNEDFGIAPVEAMAAGTPVIGVRDGFTQHQIIGRDNGICYTRGELDRAIDSFERYGVNWDAETLAEFADLNYSTGRFRNEMRQAVRMAEEQAEVDPSFKIPRKVQ